MRKILYAIWGVFVIILIGFIINEVSNEKFIDNYENEIYEENKMTAFGFFEPYIAHYNKGNVLYKNGEYDKAVEEYRMALDAGISEERDCLARINIALSMVAPINLEDLTLDESKAVVEILKEAQNVLTEHGCANEDGESGHNEDAQTLWNELQIEIQEQEEQQEDNKEDDKDNDDDNNGDDDDDDDDDEKQPVDNQSQKEQELQELIQQGQSDRQENIKTPEEEMNQEYYSGQRW